MSAYPSSGPDVNVLATSVTTPTDRVRWPSIFAGLFAALSTLVVLAVLGVAVAGSAYDPGDNARNFGIGAGIWSAISALLAFFIGGFLAARTAAVRGHRNGTLNGAMVWVVAVPLILWMLAGGINSLLRTTADTVSAGAQAATARDNMAQNNASRDVGDRAADRGDGRTGDDNARIASTDLKATTQRITQQASDPQKQEQVADTTAKSAWGTLVSLLLGLAAAAAGGYFGSRDRLFARDDRNDDDRDRNRDDLRNRPSASGATVVTPSGPPSDRH